jgi:hypothetical protein
MRRLIVVAAVIASLALSVAADKEGHMHEPFTGSAEFEQLKALAGVWKGTQPMGPDGQPMEVTVEVRVTAGGSAIVERFQPGTPMEMITIYHDRGGALTLTHYCMLGNQPQMDLASSGDGRFEFAFREGSAAAEEMHMHSLAIALKGDVLEQTWGMVTEGQEQKSTTTLSRVQ